MKNSAILLFITSVFILSFAAHDAANNNDITNQDVKGGLIQDRNMVQVGIIVRDIETSAKAWADFFGVDVPGISIASSHELNPTEYMSESTGAEAKLAFINLENITIELIQPLGEPSTWADFLEAEGEGVHHIAFDIKDMDTRIREFEEFGIPMIQHGGWETGEYGYMDGTEKLGIIIELLEHYDQ